MLRGNFANDFAPVAIADEVPIDGRQAIAFGAVDLGLADRGGVGEPVDVALNGRVIFRPAESGLSQIEPGFAVSAGDFTANTLGGGPFANDLPGDGDELLALTDAGRWEIARAARG